jgi:hypothetical protein
VLSWANHALGEEEIKMAKNVASLPFVFKHVALMPDVHLGTLSGRSASPASPTPRRLVQQPNQFRDANRGNQLRDRNQATLYRDSNNNNGLIDNSERVRSIGESRQVALESGFT